MFSKKNTQEKYEDWMTFEGRGSNPTFRLSGELGYFAAPPLEDKLQEFISSHKNIPLWVDLSAVSAIVDSRIISVLIQARRKAVERGIQLKLLGANNAVRRIFKAVKAPEMLFTD